MPTLHNRPSPKSKRRVSHSLMPPPIRRNSPDRTTATRRQRRGVTPTQVTTRPGDRFRTARRRRCRRRRSRRLANALSIQATFSLRLLRNKVASKQQVANYVPTPTPIKKHDRTDSVTTKRVGNGPPPTKLSPSSVSDYVTYVKTLSPLPPHPTLHHRQPVTTQMTQTSSAPTESVAIILKYYCVL